MFLSTFFSFCVDTRSVADKLLLDSFLTWSVIRLMVGVITAAVLPSCKGG